MNRMGFTLLVSLASSAVSNPASANDSSANQTTGGLVFTKTEAVVMRSEDLRISRQKIAVRYQFQNITDRDVTLTVAFPLPDLGADYFTAEMDRDILGENFETTVDGKPVTMQAERKAVLGDKDVTGKLKALGLSADQQATIDALDKMPAAKAVAVRKKLIEAGLFDTAELDDSRAPLWTYQRRFFREEVFPAGKTVVVTHRYRPSVAHSLAVPFQPGAKGAIVDQGMGGYCIDQDIADTVVAREKRGYMYTTSCINYTLTTGANWAGGRIGDFRLTVDKGAPENLVAFCGDNVRKVNATQFEMRKKDFQPSADLNIVIFQRMKKPAR